VTAEYLVEILEDEASGTIAETYADIKAVLAVPVVNLIYRHLAAEPGRLESTWATLRPNLAHSTTTRALALELVASTDRARPGVGALRQDDFVRAGVSSTDRRRVRATLAVYERANALNLLAVSALLNGTPGSEATDSPPVPNGARPDEILPMADPAALSVPTRTILEAMSAAVAPPGADMLVPTLYRHLASAPALLQLIWQSLEHALEGSQLGPAAERVQEQAAVLARRLPRQVDPIGDLAVRAVLERFAPAIATMLVAGRTIDQALGGAPS
jgi:hypothetical protein